MDQCAKISKKDFVFCTLVRVEERLMQMNQCANAFKISTVFFLQKYNRMGISSRFSRGKLLNDNV
jgi:hypothetical protein